MRAFRWILFFIFLTVGIGGPAAVLVFLDFDSIVTHPIPEMFRGDIEIVDVAREADYIVVGGIEKFWKKPFSDVKVVFGENRIVLQGMTPDGETYSLTHSEWEPFKMVESVTLEIDESTNRLGNIRVSKTRYTSWAATLLTSLVGIVLVGMGFAITPKRRDEPA